MVCVFAFSHNRMYVFFHREEFGIEMLHPCSDRGMYELSKRLLGVEGSTVELTLQRAANAQIYGNCNLYPSKRNILNVGSQPTNIVDMAVVSVVRKDMARQSARGLGNMNRRNILRDENSVVIL